MFTGAFYSGGYFDGRHFSNNYVYNPDIPVILPDTAGRGGFDRGIGGTGSSYGFGSPIQPIVTQTTS